MDDQKIENLLNISLNVPPDERRKSISLETGYDARARLWELIIIYSGSNEELTEMLSHYDNVRIIFLMNRYAILYTPQNNIDAIAAEPLIEYIEKPKRLYFEMSSAKAASCIPVVQVEGSPELKGNGVIVGVVDTGIDYRSMSFRNDDGTTRILSIWDQSAVSDNYTVPDYGFGVEYSEADINRSLSLPDDEAFDVTDLSGHGTAVTRIAAGNDGVAPQAHIIFVKMGLSGESDFPRTTQLMCAVDFIIRKSMEFRLPVSLNISFGNNYGDHTGTSILEAYLNSVSYVWKNSICVGSGNEADAGTHTAGTLRSQPQEVSFAISPYERSVNLQIWKYYWDSMQIELITPSGIQLPIPPIEDTVIRLGAGSTLILAYNGKPSPYSIMQEIYFDFIPQYEYIEYGIWKLHIAPVNIRSGSYEMWLPSSSALNPSTGFLMPDSSRTFTIPSTASRVITVGAYNSLNNSYAPFSGRGYTLTESGIAASKPDLSAPGVNIRVGSQTFTGTSFATPFVTGCAALLMEWGISRNNDPYLYGEKLKAYLINGTKLLPGFTQWPNPQAGFGTLCLSNSIPV